MSVIGKQSGRDGDGGHAPRRSRRSEPDVVPRTVSHRGPPVTLEPAPATSSTGQANPGASRHRAPMTARHPWLHGPIARSAPEGEHPGPPRRAHVARQQVSAWAAPAAPNGERLGVHVISDGTASMTSPTPRVHTFADSTVLLDEVHVPGFQPPFDVASVMAVRWAPDVAPTVLRDLRRDRCLSRAPACTTP